VMNFSRLHWGCQDKSRSQGRQLDLPRQSAGCMTDTLFLEPVRHANVSPYDCFELPTKLDISTVER
jgi:hypothetical protein